MAESFAVAFGLRVRAFAKFHSLTPRESSVLLYLARGYRYSDIAAELTIKHRTVKYYATRVKLKTQSADRFALIRKLHSTEVRYAGEQ